jgi:ribosomal-protein-alanine N-acetyltransferase
MISLPVIPFPTIITSSYLLRQLVDDDALEIFRLRADDRVNEFLDRPKAKTIEDGERFIHRINKGIAAGEWLYWAIVPTGEQRLIGTICYWNIVFETSKAEIGFELMPECQGRGVMREIVADVLQFGFDTLGLQKIEAVLHAGNIKSIRILEQYEFLRDPFAETGLSEMERRDSVVIYSLSKK